MLLSAKPLINVADVNSWEVSTQVQFTQGDTLYVYFQLADFSKDRVTQGFNSPGRRYVPAEGATLAVTIPNIVTAPTDLNVIKTAEQPFPGDLSIWRFQVTPADGLVGTYSLQLSLTENSVVTKGRMDNALSVSPISASFC